MDFALELVLRLDAFSVGFWVLAFETIEGDRDKVNRIERKINLFISRPNEKVNNEKSIIKNHN